MSRIIDAHLHFLEREREEENLLASMDAAGIERALLLPLPALRFMGARTAGNDVVARVCKRHPDRLAFGVFVDPREKEAAATMKQFVERGAKVLKLYPPLGFYPDDPACLELYETAAELKLPVYSHTGATDLGYWQGGKREHLASHFCDPIRFDGLARRFPEITWILAHMGFPWSVNAWFAAAANANVYLDIAGGSFWSSSLPYLYDSVGRQIPIDYDRVMWGSDNCLGHKEHLAASQGLLARLGCPVSAFDDVFGGNAARVLGL